MSTELSIVVAIIGGCVGLLGLIATIVAVSRSFRKESKEEGEQVGTIFTDLGWIKNSITRIETTTSSIQEETKAAVKMFTEQSTKFTDYMRDNDKEITTIKRDISEIKSSVKDKRKKFW